MKLTHGGGKDNDTGIILSNPKPNWGNLLSKEDIKDDSQRPGKSKKGNPFDLTNNAKVYVDGYDGKDINTGSSRSGHGSKMSGNSWQRPPNSATRYANGVSGPDGANRYGGGV